MKFIHTNGPEEGTAALAALLSGELNLGKKVLWLVAGGSNIPIATEVMRRVRGSVVSDVLRRLTMAPMDERYGPLGHKDSNWQQLILAGFSSDGIQSIPILVGKSLEDTVSDWKPKIEKAFNGADVVVAQFGIGADGHIAGILPHSAGVNSTDVVCGYKGTPFTRISISFTTIRKIDTAYLFAFGDSKKKTLHDLEFGSLGLDDQPAAILREIPKVTIYED